MEIYAINPDNKSQKIPVGPNNTELIEKFEKMGFEILTINNTVSFTVDADKRTEGSGFGLW